VRQLWSGETREAGQVAGFPHQVPFGPAVAQQGASVLAAKMLENIKTRKKSHQTRQGTQILSKVDYLSKSDTLVGVMEEMYRKVERIEI